VFRLQPTRFGEESAALRADVRTFLREEIAGGAFTPICDSWVRGADRTFTRRLGQRGWLGMTWPKEYGGQARPQRDRFVVVEELLAAGAPIASHWVAERQVGPTLLRHGTEEQKRNLIPPIARGEAVVAIGYSEPDVGSDLAAVKTRAVRVAGGWSVSGSKIWTSQAHDADWMTVLCRTSSVGDDRHQGMSLFIVTLPAAGVTVRPIHLLNGEHHFNEVVFEGAIVPDAMVLGPVGGAWRIVTDDLAFERSGPERFTSTFPLLACLVERARQDTVDRHTAAGVGELVARFWSLRAMSLGLADLIEQGQSPAIEAAVVKDLGTRFEGDVAEVVRSLYPVAPSVEAPDPLARLLAEAILQSPAFTLRGGTNEILRGIVARGLGLR
jgi:alkylation response protein AidB-like acyl-CoA dehydrogenase